MAPSIQAWAVHAQKLRPFIPDPRGFWHTAPPVRLAPRIHRQRLARAQILGTARQIVGEAGLNAVRMAEVAARANVALQTLYNLVGTRTEMLEAACCEWVTMLAESAEAISQGQELNTIFVMLDFFWAGAILQQDYATGVVNSGISEGVRADAFVKATQNILVRQLAQLSASGALVPWADVHRLAHALARASHACVREWTQAPYHAGRFREALVNEGGLLLRGALQGPEVRRLERCFDMAWD